MGTVASEITSLTIVYTTVYSDADQSKHQSSASLAHVCGIHRGPVNSSNAEFVSICWRHHEKVDWGLIKRDILYSTRVEFGRDNLHLDFSVVIFHICDYSTEIDIYAE